MIKERFSYKFEINKPDSSFIDLVPPMRKSLLPHQTLDQSPSRPFRRRGYKLAIFTCILSLCLVNLLPAIAQLDQYTSPQGGSQPRTGTRGTTGTRAYQPPQGGSPPQSGTESSTGVRGGGCKADNATALTLLAPSNPIGQTISAHPVLAWFVPDSQSLPMELQLYQYSTDNKLRLVQQAQLQSQSGIMSWSLPTDQPGLLVNQQYYWKVRIICDPNHPSEDLFADSEFQVVSPPAGLAVALSTMTDRLKRAELYAKEGLWYDAFGEAIAADSLQAKEYQLELLKSLADSQRSGDAQAHTNQLQEIVEAEQRSR